MLLLPLPEAAAAAAPNLAPPHPPRFPARSSIASTGGLARSGSWEGAQGLRAAARGGVRGLSAAWQALRVGYFWGGDGETILRVNARQLSAVGCLPGVPQLQVRKPKPNPDRTLDNLVNKVSDLSIVIALASNWKNPSIFVRAPTFGAAGPARADGCHSRAARLRATRSGRRQADNSRAARHRAPPAADLWAGAARARCGACVA